MSGTPRNWVTVDYSGQDVTALAHLSRLVYGADDDETTNPEFLRWLYFNNPAGRAITWAAIDKTSGDLVGCYSVVPLRMVIDGEHVTGSVSVNLITHPDYRKQGIFKALGQAMHTSCANAGILLSVSLAHGQSYPGFIRSLQFHDLGRRVLLVKAFCLSNIAKRIFPNAMLATICAGAAAPVRRVLFRGATRGRRGLEVEQVDRCDARFDDLWDRAAGFRPAMFVRSSAHLNWRYLGCPRRSYDIYTVSSAGLLKGYFVTRTLVMGSIRATLIVDALCDPAMPPADVWGAAMPEIERRAAEAEVDVVAVHLLEHDSAVTAMRTLGYRAVPRQFLRGPHALCVGTYLNNKNAAIALEYSSWYFMSGDNDIP